MQGWLVSYLPPQSTPGCSRVPYLLTIVLLSGPIASGKTTLARELQVLASAESISTSGLITASLDREPDRGELQTLGQSANFQGSDWLVVLYQHGNRAAWPEQRNRVRAQILSGTDRPLTIRSLRFGAFGVRAFFCITPSPRLADAVERGLEALQRRVADWDRSRYLLVE
jgi:hypothetical protein